MHRWLARVSVAPALLLLLAGCPRNVGNSDADAAPSDASRADAVDAARDTVVIGADVVADDGPEMVEVTVGRACTGTGMFPPEMGDCESGQLCLEGNAGFPNGYCSVVCSGRRCPTGSQCVVFNRQFPLCLRTCTTNADCRAMEGYICRPGDTAGSRVCAPNDGPTGERDGGACYTTTAGPNQLPALARTTFNEANLSATAERTDTVTAAEGNVVVAPMTGAATMAFIGVADRAAFMGSSVTRDGTTVIRTGATRDPMYPASSDPVLAHTADGRLHMVFLGYAFGSTGQPANMQVRVATSTDDGVTWAMPRAIQPAGTCSAFCDKPWIAIGPKPGGAPGENIYVGYMVQRGMTGVDLVTQRSEDGGMTWSAPVTFAGVVSTGVVALTPNLQTLHVGADGALHVAWTALNARNSLARYGDPNNRTQYRRSMDGGATWGPVSRVSRMTDGPVYEQPWVATDGTTIHVAYTQGTMNGAWDIVLATSTDGGMTWQHRKVNDEPDRCATHAFPALAVDATRHVAHVMWMENRFGDGAVAYAACPSDAAMPCGTNEAISDAPFTFATSRDPGRWHGDYLGMFVTPAGELWATWSDTRNGSPNMYMARARMR